MRGMRWEERCALLLLLRAGSCDSGARAAAPDRTDESSLWSSRPPLVQLLEIARPPDDPIVSACAGDAHLAFLTRRGILLTAGSNRYGQLGRSADPPPAELAPDGALDAREMDLTASDARGGAPVAAFACGPMSTAVVFEQSVLTVGDNSNAQLGRATDATQMDRRPQPIELRPALHFRLVGMSEYLGAAVTVDGRLFMWGATDGQAELDDPADAASSELRPQRASVPLLREESIEQLAVGLSHVLVRTSRGRVLSAGENDLGQLGRRAADDEPFDSFAPLHAPFRGHRFAHMSSSELHGAALTDNGAVCTWGDNEALQLGRELEEEEEEAGWAERPGWVDLSGLLDTARGEVVSAVSAGRLHTVVLTSLGRLIGWGSNELGQLGVQPQAPVSPGGRAAGGEAGRAPSKAGRRQAAPEARAGAAAGRFAARGAQQQPRRRRQQGLDGAQEEGARVDEAAAEQRAGGLDGEEAEVEQGEEGEEEEGEGEGGAEWAEEEGEWSGETDEDDESADSSFSALPVLLPLAPAPVAAPRGPGAPAADADAASSEPPPPRAVRAVFAGPSVTLVLYADGAVGSLGDVAEMIAQGEEAGMAADPHSVPMPPSVEEGEQGTQCAAGLRHSLLLTAHGQLLAWGSNAHGQLGRHSSGLARSDGPLPVPARAVPLEAGEQVVLLLASDTRSAAVSDWGRVFVWGGQPQGAGEAHDGTCAAGGSEGGDGGDEGAEEGESAGGARDATCGAGGAASSVLAIRALQPGESVLRGHLGARGLHLVTSAGRLLLFGERRGAAGEARAREHGGLVELGALALRQAQAGWAVADVACGGTHCGAVLRSGRLYLWGANSRGQLGPDVPASEAAELSVQRGAPLALPSGARAVAFCAGFDHSVALAADGRIFSWGGNEHAQLGRETGRRALDAAPSEVELPLSEGDAPLQISCGDDHVLVLTQDGRGISWGSNAHHQLGRGPLAEAAAAELDEDEAAVALARPDWVELELFEGEALWQLGAGAAHSLALTSLGYLFAFGSCRDGQCGLATGEPAQTPADAPESGAPAEPRAEGGAAQGEGAAASPPGPSEYARTSMPARGPPRPVRLPAQGTTPATARGADDGARGAAPLGAHAPAHPKRVRPPGRAAARRSADADEPAEGGRGRQQQAQAAQASSQRADAGAGGHSIEGSSGAGEELADD